MTQPALQEMSVVGDAGRDRHGARQCLSADPGHSWQGAADYPKEGTKGFKRKGVMCSRVGAPPTKASR